MPSTYTSSLRLEQQAAGENLNTWGQPKLNTVISRVDFSVAGITTKALTADYTLTSSNTADDEARAAILKFTGTGAYTVTIPSVSKAYYVQNSATGALTLTTGAGLTATIPAGDTMPVFTDGTNVRSIVVGGLALKAYIDAQAFAATNLPGISAATTGQTVTNDGATASWADVYPPYRRSARTSNTILGVADRGHYIDATSGTFTQTVTAAATLTDGWYVDYGNSGTGVVTIDPNSSETIGGASTLLVNPGEVFRISSDGTNLNVIAIKRDLGPHLVVRDVKAAGTNGGAAVLSTWTQRTLNTVITNIVGASLGSNRITVPAGTWRVEAWAKFYATGITQLRLRNVTDSTTVAVGPIAQITAGGDDVDAQLIDRFTLTASKILSLEYYTELIGDATRAQGFGTVSGEQGIYAEVRLTRLY